MSSLDNKFETFKEIEFLKIINENQFVTRGFTKSDHYVEIYKDKDKFIVLETANDSYFTVYKEFDNSKNILLKGVQFNINNGKAFRKGVWYQFDKDRKLIKEKDYDLPYKFTFEDVLKFCEKEHISVDKGPILQSTGWHTNITRKIEKEKPIWKIQWKKKVDVLETIILDGISGEVLSKRESQYVNN